MTALSLSRFEISLKKEKQVVIGTFRISCFDFWFVRPQSRSTSKLWLHKTIIYTPSKISQRIFVSYRYEHPQSVLFKSVAVPTLMVWCDTTRIVLVPQWPVSSVNVLRWLVKPAAILLIISLVHFYFVISFPFHN